MVDRAGLSRALASLFGARRRRAGDWEGLAEALRGGAAYLAQGSAFSYLRARSGMMGPRLFQDAGFGAGLEVCKWEAFGAAAQDLILIAETDLRPLLPRDRDGLPDVLAALYREVLGREALPAHRRAGGWDDLIAEFRPRAAFATAGPPMGAAEISLATARRLMAHAPVEAAIRASDAPMVINNVAFRFVDYHRRLRAELDLPALAAVLAARLPPARAC